MLDLCFCERFSAACGFLIGVFLSSTCISGSSLRTTAPGSAVFVDVVSWWLKRDSVCCSVEYVIESLGGVWGVIRVLVLRLFQTTGSINYVDAFYAV